MSAAVPQPALARWRQLLGALCVISAFAFTLVLGLAATVVITGTARESSDSAVTQGHQVAELAPETGVAWPAGTTGVITYRYDDVAGVVPPTRHLVATGTTASPRARDAVVRAYDTPAQPVRPNIAAIPARLAAEGGEGLLARIGQGVDLASERGSIGRPTPLTNSQATDLARWNGFEPTGERLRGQTIFRQGNRYIVQDIDSHMGGTWKMADSPAGLRSKGTRMGTYDEQLNRLGP